MLDLEKLKERLIEWNAPIAILGAPSDEAILNIIKAVRDKSLPPLKIRFFPDGDIVVETFKVEDKVEVKEIYRKF